MARRPAAILVVLVAPALLAAADPSGYVGSKVCAGCHRKIFERYSKVAMAHSMVPAKEAAPLESGTVTVANDALKRTFRVYREGGEVYQSESETDATGKTVFQNAYRLEFAVGSGVNGYSYAVRRGNYLFEAPLSYYARARKWDVSPGYEQVDQGFQRPLAPACVACHSGRPRPVRDRAGLYQDPPFEELAIGCENCHGPGKAHVASGGKGKSIVNPAKLQPRLAEQICMNCHQGGDTRVLQPGKDYTDFRPGTWLYDTLAIFRLASAGSEADLLEHHSAMQASRCFAGSRGKLSCFTCHDPHTRPAPVEAAAWYRGKCLTCHTQASCTATRAARAERKDDCAACHMPKRDVGTISHSALTNHRIVKVEGEPFTPAPPESTKGLIILNRPSSGETLPCPTLLTAYGELMEKDPSLQPRYLELLDQLAKEAPGNGLVQASLGSRDLRTGSPVTAAEHLGKALDLGFHSESAYADLSEALAQSGKLEDSVAALKRGIEAEPYAPRLYKFLALRYITLKQYPLAKEVMQKYVELFPEDDFMRGLLARVSR